MHVDCEIHPLQTSNLILFPFYPFFIPEMDFGEFTPLISPNKHLLADVKNNEPFSTKPLTFMHIIFKVFCF